MRICSSHNLTRPQKETSKKDVATDEAYSATLEQLGTQIESVQDFWRYNNNTPVDQIKMRESIYLFKQGFQPIWEDRRNIDGGSWTFRVPKASGPEFWTRVQVMAIGEKLQECLDGGELAAALRACAREMEAVADVGCQVTSYAVSASRCASARI